MAVDAHGPSPKGLLCNAGAGAAAGKSLLYCFTALFLGQFFNGWYNFRNWINSFMLFYLKYDSNSNQNLVYSLKSSIKEPDKFLDSRVL